MPSEAPIREPELVAAEAALVRQAAVVVDALVVQRDPAEAIVEAKRAATELMQVVGSNGLLEFNGKRYLENQHWQTIGHFYGTTARLESDKYVEFGEAHGWEATAVLVARDGRIIGRQSAMCMNDEPNWKKKPIFQLRSMAQTRASSRVYASVFRFVTVLAENVEGTPAEELDTSAPLPQRRDRTGHPGDHPYDHQPEHEDARDQPAPPVTIAKDRAARLPDGVVLITKVVETPTRNPTVTKYVLTVVGNATWPANMGTLSTINEPLAEKAIRAWHTEKAVTVTAKKTKFGFDLESIADARERPAPAPASSMPTADDIPF